MVHPPADGHPSINRALDIEQLLTLYTDGDQRVTDKPGHHPTPLSLMMRGTCSR